jgi:hypothetical protein
MNKTEDNCLHKNKWKYVKIIPHSQGIIVVECKCMTCGHKWTDYSGPLYRLIYHTMKSKSD